MLSKKTLKINPELFKMNGKLNKKKHNNTPKHKPQIDGSNSSKSNQIKKELMKKVQHYQKNKEQEKIKENKDLEKQ